MNTELTNNKCEILHAIDYEILLETKQRKNIQNIRNFVDRAQRP